MQGDINNGLDQTDIASYISTLEGSWQKLLIRSEPSLVKLASSLNDQQVEMFLIATEEKNRERVAKFETRSHQQRLDDRYSKIESRVESFIGQLTPPQTELLNSANDQLQSTFYDWIEFRRAWAESISDAYLKRSDHDAFEQALQRAILHADSFRSPQYLDKIGHNEQVWIATLEKLIVSLNDKQRKVLNRELDAIRADLEALSALD